MPPLSDRSRDSDVLSQRRQSCESSNCMHARLALFCRATDARSRPENFSN